MKNAHVRHSSPPSVVQQTGPHTSDHCSRSSIEILTQKIGTVTFSFTRLHHERPRSGSGSDHLSPQWRRTGDAAQGATSNVPSNQQKTMVLPKFLKPCFGVQRSSTLTAFNSPSMCVCACAFVHLYCIHFFRHTGMHAYNHTYIHDHTVHKLITLWHITLHYITLYTLIPHIGCVHTSYPTLVPYVITSYYNIIISLRPGAKNPKVTLGSVHDPKHFTLGSSCGSQRRLLRIIEDGV